MRNKIIYQILENEDKNLIFNGYFLFVDNSKITEQTFPQYIHSKNNNLTCMRLNKFIKKKNITQMINMLHEQYKHLEPCKVNNWYNCLELLRELKCNNIVQSGKPDFIIYDNLNFQLLFCEFKSKGDSIHNNQLRWKHQHNKYPHLFVIII